MNSRSEGSAQPGPAPPAPVLDQEGGGSAPVAPGVVLVLSVIAMSWAAPLVRFTDAPALAVAFWRLAFSLLLVAGMLTARREWVRLRELGRWEWGTAALAGVLLAGHFVSWISSLALTSVAASVALVNTQPVWVALFAAVALGEHPSRRQALGIAIAVIGASVIGLGDMRGGPDPLRGDLLALLGAVLVAAYYVIGRGLRQRIDLLPYVAIVYGFAMLTLLVALLATDVPLLQGYEPRDWWVFIALAAGPTMIGHTGQNWALRYLPAYVVNLTLLGEPVGATLIAWLLPGIAEVPPREAVIGGVLILAGIMLGMRRRQDG